jgi:hypothetical protein
VLDEFGVLQFVEVVVHALPALADPARDIGRRRGIAEHREDLDTRRVAERLQRRGFLHRQDRAAGH